MGQSARASVEPAQQDDGVLLYNARAVTKSPCPTQPPQPRVDSAGLPACNLVPMRIDVLHGANLNLLGEREPAIYGRATLADIDLQLQRLAKQLAVEIHTFQSNHEGQLVDRVQAVRHATDGYILNPGGYTHTSVVLRDALLASGRPFVEVHLSNPDAREPFRRISLLADVALARVQGFGAVGYELALRGLVQHLQGGAPSADER